MPTQDSWGSLATRANDRVERWLQATPLDNSSAHDLIEGARSRQAVSALRENFLNLLQLQTMLLFRRSACDVSHMTFRRPINS